MVTIKSKKEIELMKDVCKVVAKLYNELEEKIKPGMSTWEIDKMAEKITSLLQKTACSHQPRPKFTQSSIRLQARRIFPGFY